MRYHQQKVFIFLPWSLQYLAMASSVARVLMTTFHALRESVSFIRNAREELINQAKPPVEYRQ
jgi:hypothetical protein